eukprot:CAMPEP_0119406356 /NCGR_PEP_ID=MMETSP1335-20130426/717_1 /TAXON_ID=259385 /ORGANISM="Chrysoculter rhomboideus, Strain RCC1486" /LENGTH=56 /DNA_ID=CAMNT_0007430433 /DNA_START=165 /DNA_END=331 /DNA_ORIENTATION=-
MAAGCLRVLVVLEVTELLVDEMAAGCLTVLVVLEVTELLLDDVEAGSVSRTSDVEA